MLEMFDFSEMLKRAIKYLVEGLWVCCFLIPKQSLNIRINYWH